MAGTQYHCAVDFMAFIEKSWSFMENHGHFMDQPWEFMDTMLAGFVMRLARNSPMKVNLPCAARAMIGARLRRQYNLMQPDFCRHGWFRSRGG